jgi:hypothetical protein
MALDPKQSVELVDMQGRLLGQVSIKRIEGNRLFGRFEPALDFRAVERLFSGLDEAVNDQLFVEADALSRRIDDLGLKLVSTERCEQLELRNVQLMNGSDLSCEIPNLGLIQMEPAEAQAR